MSLARPQKCLWLHLSSMSNATQTFFAWVNHTGTCAHVVSAIEGGWIFNDEWKKLITLATSDEQCKEQNCSAVGHDLPVSGWNQVEVKLSEIEWKQMKTNENKWK